MSEQVQSLKFTPSSSGSYLDLQSSVQTQARMIEKLLAKLKKNKMKSVEEQYQIFGSSNSLQEPPPLELKTFKAYIQDLYDELKQMDSHSAQGLDADNYED